MKKKVPYRSSSHRVATKSKVDMSWKNHTVQLFTGKNQTTQVNLDC